MVYGYKFDGSFSPEDGLYFDSSKILIDPYAKAVVSIGEYGALGRKEDCLPQMACLVPSTNDEGWSDCCLAIEGSNEEIQIVANGQVEKKTDVRVNHSRSMPPGHARVTITEDIVPTALLPCPNDELVYVCHAKRSYIAWPITLIFPRKFFQKDPCTYSTENVDEIRDLWAKYVVKLEQDDANEGNEGGMNIA